MDFVGTLQGRPNTIATHTSLFNKWIKGTGSNPDLASLISYWHKAGLAPSTISTLAILANRYREFQGLERQDVKSHLSMIKRSKQEDEIKALSKEDAAKLIQEIKGTKLYLPCMIALHTGMRRGEVWGLQWDDIDFLKGEITVSKSYNGPTKNGRTRKVPISKQLEDVLFANLELRADNYIGEKVVVTKFHPNEKLKGACRKAGVEPITFHNLRHTHATIALDAGISPKKVQRQLGHSSVTTTLNIYWSASKEKLDLEFLDGL